MLEEIQSVADFYDRFASDYHLVYGGDWDGAVERWGAALDRLIREALPIATEVLDCSCGIGTQTIGLARRGYHVRGTDLSAGQIERARVEAARLGVTVSFSVADFRDLSRVRGVFDVVISCDNAIPHLLNQEDVLKVLRQMRAKLCPGGLVTITMRDFDQALREKPAIAPPTVVAGPPRRVLLRFHDWDQDGAPLYTVRFLVLTEEASGWTVTEHTTRYRAVTREELTWAAERAGFSKLAWHIDDQVVPIKQQVMTGINPA